MSGHSFTKISKGEIRGLMHQQIFHALPPHFFDDPVVSIKEMGGKVLKESKWRWAALFMLGNGQRVFLKRDRTKDWMESLKFLILPSRARKEWFIAHQMLKKNVDIPKTFGWLERGRWGFVKESYYLSEAVGSGVSLIDSVRPGGRFPLEELVETVRKIHGAGLFHKDLHGGNFLWDGESLFIIDLHRAEILKTLSLKRRLWNLSHLFHSLRATWKEEDQAWFVDHYFEGESASSPEKEAYLRQIRSGMETLQKRQWKSRTKRCHKESTEFTVQKGEGVRYYQRRDYPLDRVKKAVEEHLKLVRDDPSKLVKRSDKINVSILKDNVKTICVKQFRNLTLWDILKDRFRTPKGFRAWVGAHGLKVRRFPSLGALGLVEKRSWLGLRESFFLMEVLEKGQELDRYIFEGLADFRKRRHFIRAFAEWLAHFHQRGLYHRDMKACNVFLSENGAAWNFYFLDLEDLRLDGKVSEKKLFKNFLQLNTSTPKTVTTTDRFRFFGAYLRLNPIVKDRKSFLRRLINESKRRGLVYVAPWGVVTERL